jgi:hypothetical protein
VTLGPWRAILTADWLFCCRIGLRQGFFLLFFGGFNRKKIWMGFWAGLAKGLQYTTTGVINNQLNLFITFHGVWINR